MEQTTTRQLAKNRAHATRVGLQQDQGRRRRRSGRADSPKLEGDG